MPFPCHFTYPTMIYDESAPPRPIILPLEQTIDQTRCLLLQSVNILILLRILITVSEDTVTAVHCNNVISFILLIICFSNWRRLEAQNLVIPQSQRNILFNLNMKLTSTQSSILRSTLYR